MASTARIIQLHEARNARSEKLEVTLSELVTRGPGKHGVITLETDPEGVELVVASLSRPGFASRGVLRSLSEVRPNEDLAKRMSYWTHVGLFKVFYNFSIAHYRVEIEAIFLEESMPSGGGFFRETAVRKVGGMGQIRGHKASERSVIPFSRHIIAAATIAALLFFLNGATLGVLTHHAIQSHSSEEAGSIKGDRMFFHGGKVRHHIEISKENNYAGLIAAAYAAMEEQRDLPNSLVFNKASVASAAFSPRSTAKELSTKEYPRSLQPGGHVVETLPLSRQVLEERVEIGYKEGGPPGRVAMPTAPAPDLRAIRNPSAARESFDEVTTQRQHPIPTENERWPATVAKGYYRVGAGTPAVWPAAAHADSMNSAALWPASNRR